ncbi:hypothetical protein ACS0TY_023692 [Phlomoides rotata]
MAPHGVTDSLIWHYNRLGTYSVKSAYELALRIISDLSNDATTDWKLVWQVDAPPKIKQCVWRVVSGSLPTTNELVRRHFHIDAVCAMCSSKEESDWHVFFGCQYVRECWRFSPINHHVQRVIQIGLTVQEAFSSLLRILNKEEAECFAGMVWRIWKERNAKVWNGTFSNPSVVWSLISGFLQEFHSVKIHVSSNREMSLCKAWHPPISGLVKLNVDATFFKDTFEMGLGFVIRDWLGEFIIGRSLILPGYYTADVGEAYGVYEALSWIKMLNMDNVVIEMDAKLVFDALKGSSRERKGDISVNALAVCDIHMNYIYVLTGWEGSAADSRVL